MASRDNARRFHFLREIASGGFGTVYLCKVVHADGFSRLAAVKVLKAQWSDSDEVVRRIRDEARLLGLLRHRHIIAVSDLTSIDGRAAVVMELVEGVDLRAVGRHLAEDGATMPVKAALEITAAVASALDAAYNRPPLPGDKPLRVIHRDIKPSNVMVDRQGEVKVLDFGVARSELSGRESHTEELQFGSVDYMAPERLFFEPETPAGDIYALGATLFEALALEKLGKARGRPDQHAASVEDRLSFLRACLPLRGTVASELTDLIRAMVHFEHERRPSAAEVMQHCRALARLMDGEELQSWAERVIPPLVEAAARAPALAGGLAETVCTEDSVSRGFLSEVEASAPQLGSRLQQAVLRELEDSSARIVPAHPTLAPAPANQTLAPAPEPAPANQTLAPAPEPAPANQTLAPAPEPAAVRRSPVLDPLPPAPELDDPEAWNDLPTVVGQLGDPTEALEPASEALRPAAPIAAPLPPRPEVPSKAAPSKAAPSKPGAPAPSVAPADRSLPPRPGPPPAEPVIAAGLPPPPPGPLAVAPPTGAPPPPLASGTTPPAASSPAPGNRAVEAFLDELESTVVNVEEPTGTTGPLPAKAPPRKGTSPVVAMVAGGLVGGCLLVGVAVVVAAVVGAVLLKPGGDGAGLSLPWPLPTTPPTAETATAPPTGEPGPVALVEEEPATAAPGVRFRSEDPQTRKLNVRCAQGEASGAGEAVLSAAQPGRCVVTAMGADRSRRVAVIEVVEAPAYACFGGAEDACQPR